MVDGLPYIYFKTAPFGFDTTVYDTDDLSITRGSSLTLLAMPEHLKTHLCNRFSDVSFDWIQSSASELVFRAISSNKAPELTIKKVTIKAPNPKRAAQWKKALQAKAVEIKNGLSDARLLEAAKELAENTDLDVHNVAGQILKKCGGGHAGPQALSKDQCSTICAEVEQFTSKKLHDMPFDLMLFNTVSFKPKADVQKPTDIIAALNTRLGHARFQKLACMVPEVAAVGGLSAKEAVCQFTGIYAAGSNTDKEKKRATSPGARRRRKVGRDQKDAFYADILSTAKAAAKTHDLANNPLVGAALVAIEAAEGKIDKFANDFSDIVSNPPEDHPLSLQSNLCVLNMDGNGFGALFGGANDFETYRRFSTYLDILKAGLLARILLWIADETNGMIVDGAARFETLLWGGDEFTFVVPAWKGWELGIVIDKAVTGWKTLDGVPMTFSTGLAFGPHKAPIRDLKAAAEALANLAKRVEPKIAAWQAIAFESVDRVHFSPSQYRADWLGKNVENCHFSLLAKDAVTLPDTIANILEATSNSALHKLYYAHKDHLADRAADRSAVLDQIDHIAPAMPKGKLSAVKDALVPDGDYSLLRFAQINLLLEYIRSDLDQKGSKA